MRFHLLLALLVMFSQALGAASLDLTSDHIERVASQETKESGHTQWQNILCFSNTTIRIPLARSAVTRTPGAPDFHQGFDPTSLKLQWLKADELLLISWSTFAMGGCHRTFDGHVLLQIQGSKVHEIFRDYFMSAYKGGWGDKSYSSLEIAYDDQSKTIKLSRHVTQIIGDTAPLNPPQPFTEVFQGDNGIQYFSQVNSINTWFYRLDKGAMKFLRGSDALDLEKEQQPIEEIIKYFHSNRAALQKLNPSIRGHEKATGVLVLRNDVKPYEAQSDDDGLEGGTG